MRLTRFRLVLIGFGLLASLFGGTIVALRHEPDFYRRAAVPAGPHRYETSNEFFVRDFVRFIASFQDGRGQWQCKFTQEQINSFFEEDFVRFGDADYFRKIGITNPRVEFADNQIRFGFRYGHGWWSTVLSYDLKVWLVKSDVNVLAIEIQQRRIGALPVPTQHIFQELKDLGRRQNIDIEWYRHNGNPVAIVKFQCDKPRPISQLQHVEIRPGTLNLQILSNDPALNPLEEQIKKAPVQVSANAAP